MSDSDELDELLSAAELALHEYNVKQNSSLGCYNNKTLLFNNRTISDISSVTKATLPYQMVNEQLSVLSYEKFANGVNKAGNLVCTNESVLEGNQSTYGFIPRKSSPSLETSEAHNCSL